jgi:transposase
MPKKTSWVDKKFKVKAVKDYLSGTSIANIAKSMGVHKATVYNWTRKYYTEANQGSNATPKRKQLHSKKVNGSKLTFQPIMPRKVNSTKTQDAADLKDIKIAGTFELVDGKAFATDIVVGLGVRTKFKLTKDTLKLLNDLGEKLL